MTMKTNLIIFAVALTGVLAAPKRAKREAYALPDGADVLVGPVKTSFQCSADGYYADVDNNCQIFHVCHSVENADGSLEQQHWSFLCGNQTLFNQYSLTCATPEESIPCFESASFFYLNERLRSDDPKMYFLNDEDVQRAMPLIPMYKSAGSPAAAAPGPGPAGVRPWG